MQNKIITVGPLALTNTTTTNILNPPTTTGGVNGGSSSQYIIVRQIHVCNKTSGAATFSLWKGLTGANTAGTELFSEKVVAARDVFVWYGPLRLDAADFLVGGASANTTLTITLVCESGVAG